MIFVVSIGALSIHGLKWGLDFTGGTQIEVSYPGAADLPLIRENLSRIGFREAQVVSYGTSKDVLISIAPRADKDQSRYFSGFNESGFFNGTFSTVNPDGTETTFPNRGRRLNSFRKSFNQISYLAVRASHCSFFAISSVPLQN